MKRSLLCLLLPLIAVAGCGQDDPNKNLRPVEANVPRIKEAVDNPVKGGEKPSAVLK